MTPEALRRHRNVMVRTKAHKQPDWETAFNQNRGNFEAAVKSIGPLRLPTSFLASRISFGARHSTSLSRTCTRQSWIERFTAARETTRRAGSPIVQS